MRTPAPARFSTIARRSRRWWAVLIVAALVAAACGDSDGGEGAASSVDSDAPPPTAAADSDDGEFVSAESGGAEGDVGTAETDGAPGIEGVSGVDCQSGAIVEQPGVPAGVGPLRGTGGTDPAGRPTVIVKIGNNAAARPQRGLNQADVVYEVLVEGGITRFVALFQSEVPASVGPVRSSRGSDVSLVMGRGNPIFATSGGNPGTTARLAAAAINDATPDAVPGAYIRADDRSAPDNLYADMAALLCDGGQLVPNGRPAAPPTPIFDYLGDGGTVPVGARPAVGVEIGFGAETVTFTWDAARGLWLRAVDGAPHLDDTGAQIAVENVIVQFADYTDTGQRDANGAPVISPVLDGVFNGLGWVLTDGQVIEVTWEKQNFTAPTFYLLDGLRVPITPGRTWVELPEEGMARLL